MDTYIPAFFRRQRYQRRLTLEMLSAKVGMSPQHLSEIESGKRDPRLSSIERMAAALDMTVLIVPQTMAPDLRRYVANNGRMYTTSPTAASTAPHSDAAGAAEAGADTCVETIHATTTDTTTDTKERSHAHRNNKNTHNKNT